MALVTLPTVEIEIDIPDLVIGAITLKRKAKLFTMIYNQAVKSLTLTWIVSYPDLQGMKGLQTYSKESVADNSTMVDTTTGAILQPTITNVPVLDANGNPVLDANGNPETTQQTTYPGTYTGQYDFFNYLAENDPIKVHDMIRQYGAQADWS